MTQSDVDSRSPSPQPEETIEPESKDSISRGRYVYCLVDATTGEPSTLSVTGLDGNPVSVIVSEDIGAVSHECDSIYDSSEMEQVKQWIITHQQVVDAAGEHFDTPLPMRFDTIFEGGDTSVKQWLQNHSETICTELDAFTGTWEYRLHLMWDPSVFEEQITAEDDRLQELHRRQQQAGAGKRFLLQKQYDKRLRELKQQRRSALTEALTETVAPVVTEITDQPAQSTLEGHSPSSSESKERITRLAVRADKTNETPLGDRLDGFVEKEGVEIRFTGPWPPYTFAPEIG